MQIALISFSETGAALAVRLSPVLAASGHTVKSYVARRYAEETGLEPFASVYELTASLFNETDALVFVSASGIAVRAVAPLVTSKLTDPAVVVCDETGRFAVSLLSGHAGGANRLAAQIAEVIGAIPVITTASDAHAAMDGLEQPRNLVLGIGCRRGLAAETIERSATILLWDAKIPLARVCEAATIDVKKGDDGLAGFVRAHGIPLTFYSAEELAEAPGEFTSSERVLREVGVDNVCERAAALRGGEGKLILRKATRDGVAVAVFEKECTLE